jgi:hypothetical protein
MLETATAATYHVAKLQNAPSAALFSTMVLGKKHNV